MVTTNIEYIDCHLMSELTEQSSVIARWTRRHNDYRVRPYANEQND